MTLLQKISDRPGVDFIEVRESLYYNKYKYRASIYISGLRNSYYITIDKFNSWKILQSLDKEKIKVRIEGSTASIFSNDLSVLLTLNECYINSDNKVKITEIIVNGNNEVKYYVHKPKHNYRMYFKSYYSSRLKNINIINDVFTILEDYKDRVFPSPKLEREISRQDGSVYFYGCYLDLDSEIDVSFITLRYDHLFKKVYKLEKLPEIKEMINTL